MNYEEALSFIHSTSPTFCKPGLDRINALLDRLGHPERTMKFIHVAGTNGKGSTSSMLASVLMAAGYRVGLYTSPYVYRFNERMRVCGVPISDEQLTRLTEMMRPIVSDMPDSPTEFELITAIAFQYFSEEKCEVVVLEVGMGGRLDSTNVIDAPLLSVITGISLDHTAFLGDTVEKIAFEKAGIIKSGCPVIWGGSDEAAAEVISRVAGEVGARLYTTDYSRLSVDASALSGTVFSYKERLGVEICLLGTYQPKNASLVLDSIDILRTRGLKISEEAVRRGLAEASWPARFEVISTSPTVIFDGAHNAEGIGAATESIKHYFGDRRVVICTGVLSDKDYGEIARKISEVSDLAFTVTPDNPRALGAEAFASVLRDIGVAAYPTCGFEEAIPRAMAAADERDTAVCILGSLYTYRTVIDTIRGILRL